MRSRLLILCFLPLGIFLNHHAFSQGGYKVTGTIIDAESGGPLEYASISLLTAQDSTLVDGGITDENGKFSIEGKSGQFIVQAQFISYGSKFFNVELSSAKKVANLGKITLSPDAATLDEVVVTGQKSQMVMELDKRVFNVGEDLRNAGSSAAEILDNIPSVNVDIEGNVSLRGSNNVRILVNGKPSGLVGISSTDALRQLQGNLVERVEVVTNPSARYEAEGNAGIINIILKKDNNDGINGSFSANVGYPDNYGLSFNVNFRKKWMNLFANYGVNYRKSPGSGYADEEFYNNGDTTYRTTIRERTRGGLSNNFRIGSDFYLNDKNTLTVSGMYRISDEENETELIYKDYDNTRTLRGATLRTDNEKEDEANMEFSLNWEKTFEKEGRKLTAEVQYRESDELEDSDQREGPLPGSGERFDPGTFQQSLNDEYENNLLMQADYEHSFGSNGKLELGYRGNIRKIDNKYLVEELNEAGVFESLPNFSNHFKYDENIHAGYVMLGNKVKRFSFQLGLRAEYTDLSTALVQTNEKNYKNYLGFFPSAHVTYELPNKNSFQASYSRRLDRPGFWSLNPFSNYTDPRSIRAGNPDLDPEYTDAYELGYLKNWSGGSIFTSIYYRHSTDVIDRVQYREVVNEDTVLFMLPQNLSSRNSYGVEFTASKDVNDWWNINGSTNFFRAITEGQFREQNLSSDAYSMSARMTSKMTFFDVLDYQLSGRYYAPREDTQGRRKAFYTIDMGLSKDVLGKKGTLTLNVRDILNSMKWRGETYGNNFSREAEFQWRARQVTMSFTYRLNQKKKPERGGRNGGFDGDDGGDF